MELWQPSPHGKGAHTSLPALRKPRTLAATTGNTPLLAHAARRLSAASVGPCVTTKAEAVHLAPSFNAPAGRVQSPPACCEQHCKH